MVTISSTEARHMRATLLAYAALLEEPVKPKKKRKSAQDRYDEMYTTGRIRKPEQLKKRKRA